MEIDTELLNPRNQPNKAKRKTVKIIKKKKETQALNYSKVTSQARYRRGDSAMDGDTYLVQHVYG